MAVDAIFVIIHQFHAPIPYYDLDMILSSIAPIEERSGERFREREREKDEEAELHSRSGFGVCGVKLLPLRERRRPRLRRLHRCLHHRLR